MGSSWKQSQDFTKAPAPKVSLTCARKFYAVDASGSTAGKIIILEGQTVKRFHANPQSTVARWGSTCTEPVSVDSTFDAGGNLKNSYWRGDQGGTYPQCVLDREAAMSRIQSADMWYLLTDGEIMSNDVEELAARANQYHVSNVPICMVIVGELRATPEMTNISVGIPFYAAASEAIILFKDASSRKLYVVAAKGPFMALAKNTDVGLGQWDNLASFASEDAFNEACDIRGIEITRSEDRMDTSAVSLGPAWDATTKTLVDVTTLLAERRIDSKDLDNLLEESAFQQLTLICKTRHQISDLRAFLLRHKQQEVFIQLEDLHGAGPTLQKLQACGDNEEAKQQLAQQLREAHAANRKTYLELKNSPSEEARKARDTNRAINRALEHLANTERTGYTAGILDRKSNRARRADILSAEDAEVRLSSVDLSDAVKGFRSTCSICCGEDQIMSIVLKTLGSVEENTSDFFLNFPLVASQAIQNANMISSQCICFQCATAIGRRSIFKEDLSAILPVVDYSGPNKPYINHQLTMAITAGIATGTAGVVQMFLSILDHTLENKSWCSAQALSDGSVSTKLDSEIFVRRQSLGWMLQNLLVSCRTRERFSDETSPWVSYPTALKWAISDFKEHKLDSWMIQYPLKGCNQLLRWYQHLNLPIAEETLEEVKVAKLLNVVVSHFMIQMFHNRNCGDWTHPFMQLIYRGFNATNVPRDIRGDSILHPDTFWTQLEISLGGRNDVHHFLQTFSVAMHHDICRRVQVIVFWAVFTHKGHSTAKTFFEMLRLREELAPALLDPATPIPDEAILIGILRSIFIADGMLSDETHLKTPQFVTPFGPSVLSCGNCGVSFYDPSDPSSTKDNVVRKRRAEHFNDVFRMEPGTDTGLPEPVKAPNRPTSSHYNLHSSIARTWSQLPLSIPKRNSQGLFFEESLPSREAVWKGDSDAVTKFITQTRIEICANSRRGNIYWAGLEGEIRELLPSFFTALKVASEKEGLEDRSGLSYVHDWRKNKVSEKVEYELSLL